MTKIAFKSTSSNQETLFPARILDRIPANHPVLIVNQVVDNLNIDNLLSSYSRRGASSYHPRMMLKVLFYAYLSNIYSCRKIAQALEENIYFMWLSGDSLPDFRTINRFRGEHLKEHIKDLFTQIVLMLNGLGYVSLDVQYIDGTKIEASANKYSFVWRGSVEKYKEKLESKVSVILKNIDSQIEQDKQDLQACFDTKAIDLEELKQEVKALNARKDGMTKAEQKQVKQLQEDYLPRLEKYESQLEQMAGRNSYSKTDVDATFMRMKEDHMKNGQLKPAYNVQISTENQFITNTGLYQRAGDTATLPSFLEDFQKTYDKQSKVVVADAGYGSEQNYELMEESGIEAYVKYNFFHKEQKRAWNKDAFAVHNLFYNAEKDFYICPMGQKMTKIGLKKTISALAYISTSTRYQAANCHGCPLRGLCHKSKTNRIIEVNYKLQNFRKKAKERLLSDQGVYHRGQRCIEPEAVFGQIKWNSGWNRFRLRGLDKVKIEFNLVAIAHNLKKMAKKHFLQALLCIWYLLKQVFCKKDIELKRKRLTTL